MTKKERFNLQKAVAASNLEDDKDMMIVLMLAYDGDDGDEQAEEEME